MLHFKTVIAMVGSLPLTVGVNLLQYIYQDWEFAKWIGIAIGIDTLLGIIKHIIYKDFSSEDFWSKFAKKIFIYIVLLILSNILINYTVKGHVVGTTQWFGEYLCVAMLLREAISVLENINAIYPVLPPWILKRMKDFNDSGEYVNKKNEKYD